MQEIYAGSMSSHFGNAKTYYKTAPRFYWPEQKRQVEEFVKCAVCEQVKTPAKCNRAPLKPLITARPFQIVTTDMMGPFPKSPRGNEYVIVFIDHFTKWVEVFPIPDQTAKTAAYCLRKLIARHGLSEALLAR